MSTGYTAILSGLKSPYDRASCEALRLKAQRVASLRCGRRATPAQDAGTRRRGIVRSSWPPSAPVRGRRRLFASSGQDPHGSSAARPPAHAGLRRVAQRKWPRGGPPVNDQTLPLDHATEPDEGAAVTEPVLTNPIAIPPVIEDDEDGFPDGSVAVHSPPRSREEAGGTAHGIRHERGSCRRCGSRRGQARGGSASPSEPRRPEGARRGTRHHQRPGLDTGGVDLSRKQQGGGYSRLRAVERGA